MAIQTVGICGGGLMGLGIAQTLAQQGLTVPVRDIEMGVIQRGLQRTRTNLEGQVHRGRMQAADMEATLSRIKPTTDLHDIANMDLVIEAVPEDMALKKKVFAELDAVCPPRTILASNTSTLSPTEMGSATQRPAQTIGMHWFNPAPVMKLIEVTAGIETAPETVEAIMEFAHRVGKTPVKVNEAPGGIVSRILCAMRNAAADIYLEGVASAEDIDTAMKLGANFPMGPLELIDLVGVDVHLFNSDSIARETGDPRYRPNAHLRKMVRAGWLGRKTGRGFYKYEKGA